MFEKKKPEKESTEKEKKKKEVEELLKKYTKRIKTELKQPTIETGEAKPVTTKEYQEFKQEYLPKHMSWYEKACNFSEKTLKISPDKKKISDYQESINICHLNVTPSGVASFAILAPVCIAVLGSILSYIIFQSTFFILFFLLAGVVLIKPLQNYPMYLANSWRMKASNQMVLCIFYVVTYMRHTSNLELAIEFASDHLDAPLSLDLKKVLWDVETEKYESVKESLDIYLDTWKKWNLEFIEAFHLIESSLYEGSEDRRVSLLEKSLSVILEETYEKMLHYAQNLKSPITMLHMMGIILPILGLVMLPLVVSFLCQVRWYHLALLYNITLPLVVYYMGKNILSTRPTGYGDTDISETNPKLKKYRNLIIKFAGTEIVITPLIIAVIIGLVFFFVGITPVVMHVANPGYDYVYKGARQGFVSISNYEDPAAQYYFLGYKKARACEGAVKEGEIIGPFGMGASLLSLAITLGIGLSAGVFFRLRSRNVIKIREESKKLEDEFASALFQLGNRLGDGLPAEVAFGKVAGVMEGTTSGRFFQAVSDNITNVGMNVEKAIFDKEHGALLKFPSKLIESSMKVLSESIKKGPRVAAQALINISIYVKEIHRVNERLKDLMADIVSSMKSQIKFLTPVIAGVVIGITSMITTIIGKLGVQMRALAVKGGEAPTGLMEMFGDGIPTFYFQVIVGLYVVQIIYVLTILTNGIENGSDKLGERYSLGINLVKSTFSYVLIAAIVMLIFNIIAGLVIKGTAG